MAKIRDLGPAFRVSVSEVEMRRWKEATGARLPTTRPHYITYDKRTGEVLDSSLGAAEWSIHGGWLIAEMRTFGREMLEEVAKAHRRNPEWTLQQREVAYLNRCAGRLGIQKRDLWSNAHLLSVLVTAMRKGLSVARACSQLQRA